MNYLEINVYEYKTKNFLGQRVISNFEPKFSAGDINRQVKEIKDLHKTEVYFNTTMR